MASPTYKYDNFKVTFPSDFVAQVEIDRPSKLHAFHPPMWYELGSIFTTLSTDPNVRAIVLTSTGDRAFTAGLDVQAASSGPLGSSKPSGDVARVATELRRHIADYQAQVSAIEKCEKPVIVLLNGISYGMAIDIATACDVRLCTKDVRMCVKEVDIGLAADVGTLSRLPKANVSFSWIKDVSLTAREFGAKEALDVGFVSGVFETKSDGLRRAHELARLIAKKSPVAVQVTKEVLNYSRDHTVQEGLDYVKVWNMSMLQTKDVTDSMMAGLQKRTPTFEKL